MRHSLVLLFTLILALPGPLGAQETLCSTFDRFRHQAGVSVPVWNPLMAQASEARAQDLVQAQTLSHQDDQGRGPGVQMLLHGFPPGEYGEVLGAGPQWQAVWEAWLASPTHRQVLSTPGWQQWAFGAARLGKTTVWVLRLYRP